MAYTGLTDAGWSSSVARWAHNPEVAGSNPVPATNTKAPIPDGTGAFGLSRPRRNPGVRGSVGQEQVVQVAVAAHRLAQPLGVVTGLPGEGVDLAVAPGQLILDRPQRLADQVT